MSFDIKSCPLSFISYSRDFDQFDYGHLVARHFAATYTSADNSSHTGGSGTEQEGLEINLGPPLIFNFPDNTKNGIENLGYSQVLVEHLELELKPVYSFTEVTMHPVNLSVTASH